MASLRTERTVHVAVAVVATLIGLHVLRFGFGDDAAPASGVSLGLILLGGVALLLRRRWPIEVLVIAALVHFGVARDFGDEPAALPIVAVALYTAAREGDDRRRQLSIAAGIAAVTAIGVSVVGGDPFLAELPGEAALLFLPVAVGDAIRSRSDRLKVMIDAEAMSRVQDERLRIARDLHDVVAHGLSTMTIRAGVAAHLLERDPNQAQEALEDINSVGKEALEELRAMVGALRTTDQEPDAPLVPVPSEPDDLSRIIEGAERAGLPVTAEIIGSFPPDVVDGCVVALHRIVHEALVNVARHAGPVETTVSVRHGDDGVELAVINTAGAHVAAHSVAPASTGVGVVGMAERAESIGGKLSAGPVPDGGFAVRAALPYRRPMT